MMRFLLGKTWFLLEGLVYIITGKAPKRLEEKNEAARKAGDSIEQGSAKDHEARRR